MFSFGSNHKDTKIQRRNLIHIVVKLICSLVLEKKAQQTFNLPLCAFVSLWLNLIWKQNQPINKFAKITPKVNQLMWGTP